MLKVQLFQDVPAVKNKLSIAVNIIRQTGN